MNEDNWINKEKILLEQFKDMFNKYVKLLENN